MRQIRCLILIAALLLMPLAPLSTRAADSQPPANGRDFDLQGLIDREIQAGAKRVVIPPGRYRVTPKAAWHLIFYGLADIEIIADGVELICIRTVQALHFENCRNVTLRGLTIDYDPLPFTEGRITALAPDKSWVEFEIIDGYPESALQERIEIYDPKTLELRRETGAWSQEFATLGNHRYRIAKRAGYHFREQVDTEQVGDILVTNNMFPPQATHHAVWLSRCTQARLEGITLYASPLFGFLEQQCDATTYLRCKIDRRAPQDDPVPRGFPRVRSLDADAFHSTQATRGPAIIDCTARFQGDDCVNIHGVYHFIAASDGPTLRVAALKDMTIEPGDPVEFLPFSGRRPPDAVAVAIEPDHGITDAERDFVRKLHMNDRNQQRLLDGLARFYRLKLDRAVPLAMGSAVCSGRRVGNGFAVRGCDFGHNRSRGILIKASHGEVSGNKISHGWMSAVLVAPEFWWFEAASASDLVIRDNVITGCRRPAIEIIATGGDGKLLASGAHRDIRITGNRITRSAWPNIHVTSTSGLMLDDNQLDSNAPLDFVPPLETHGRKSLDSSRAILTEQCEAAEAQPR